MKNDSRKLKDFLKAFRLLRKHGHYDISIVGAVAEAYAEEVLGMEKAPAGTKGYDGKIKGRKVQVKGKAPRKDSSFSRHYAAISLKNHRKADDLFVLFIEPNIKRLTENQLKTFGPLPISKLTGKKNDRERRYYLSEMEKIMSKRNK